MLQYEDELLKATALSVLPQNIWELIGSQGAQQDELARRLLAFFKNEFFTWVGFAETLTRCASACCRKERDLSSAQDGGGLPFLPLVDSKCHRRTASDVRCWSCGCKWSLTAKLSGIQDTVSPVVCRSISQSANAAALEAQP